MMNVPAMRNPISLARFALIATFLFHNKFFLFQKIPNPLEFNADPAKLWTTSGTEELLNPLENNDYVTHTAAGTKEPIILPRCETCDDNVRCADLLARTPDLLTRCAENPGDSVCELGCFDEPEEVLEDSNLMVLNNNDNNHDAASDKNLWPPLGEGRWTEDPDYCRRFQDTTQACLLDKYRWTLAPGNSEVVDTFDSETACALLHRSNITDIKFAGDSLVRHIWQGLLLVLTGDWNTDLGRGKECANGLIFSEHRTCRRDGTGAGMMVPVCPHTAGNYSIEVRFQENITWRKKHHPWIESVEGRGKTLHIYGVGNHPPLGDYTPTGRIGVLNVTMWNELKWKPQFNKPFFWGDGHYFIWVPPHFKLSIGRHDETNQRALSFLKESHELFAKFQAPTFNSFTLTKRAIPFFCRKCERQTNASHPLNPSVECEYYERETCQTTKETWDGFHYGRALNTWKAHLLLRMFSQLLAE
jgi:hypothetical protein